ncbi:MAG: hypothetical protein AB7K24_04670 [Gemmataceae bacterium]
MRKKTLPKTLPQWLKEIHEALREAKEPTKLETPWATKSDIFQMAPYIVFNFRGVRLDENQEEQTVRRAFANCVLAEAPKNGIKHGKTKPNLAFAFCYVSTHLVLELVDKDDADRIMGYCEKHIDKGL